MIKHLEPQTLAEHREEVLQNSKYLDNLEKFEKEVKQKTTRAMQAKQNTPFFAGVAVAVFASIVGLIPLGLNFVCVCDLQQNEA